VTNIRHQEYTELQGIIQELQIRKEQETNGHTSGGQINIFQPSFIISLSITILFQHVGFSQKELSKLLLYGNIPNWSMASLEAKEQSHFSKKPAKLARLEKTFH